MQMRGFGKREFVLKFCILFLKYLAVLHRRKKILLLGSREKHLSTLDDTSVHLPKSKLICWSLHIAVLSRKQMWYFLPFTIQKMISETNLDIIGCNRFSHDTLPTGWSFSWIKRKSRFVVYCKFLSSNVQP